jgi:uncharacterized membrane protein
MVPTMTKEITDYTKLFVIGFDEPQKAEELRLKLQELRGKYVLDLQEMVVAVKDDKEQG